LKSSANFSATPTSPSHAGTPHRRFALTGRSVALDPRTHAVRGDLADLRLADRVFAPHYAAPMAVEILSDVPLRSAASPAADVIAALAAGDTFEVLELAGVNAWGVAPAHGLVGYIAASAIAGAGA
jgi:hypothetical protein